LEKTDGILVKGSSCSIENREPQLRREKFGGKCETMSKKDGKLLHDLGLAERSSKPAMS